MIDEPEEENADYDARGVTVSPDPVRGSEGMCWGIGHAEAFAAARGDASDVRKALAPMMPETGEDRASVADVYASVYGHCTELLAGRAAESLFSQHGAAGVSDDLRQARELALLICSSARARRPSRPSSRIARSPRVIC